jgi:NAD(P)-dependent dehydrogenase (short-subunit alcohol dehydrogenase family)
MKVVKMDMFDKVAIVPAASSGIGKTIRFRLASKGARLAVVSNSVESILE